jgi:6-phosphogluconolactonase
MSALLKFLSIFLLCTPLILMAQEKKENRYYHLLVGTYTNGMSEGVYVYRFDSKTGKLTHEHTAKGVSNPSFVIVSANQQYAYAVNEHSGEKEGMVSAFRFNPANGQLDFINQQPSGGGDPCYLSLSPNGKHLLVGNYTGGSVSVLPVQADGSLGAPIQTIVHEGSSINPNRQEKAHVHSTVFGPQGNKLFVGDLGTDKVYAYAYEPEAKKPIQPAEVSFTTVDPGRGPRHLLFNKKGTYAYLIQELNASLAVFQHENGKLQHIQDIPMAASDFKGEQSGAEVRLSPDEKFLYTSNRGDANEITIFAIDQQQGTLKTVGRQSTLGLTPRNFIIDPSGRFLLVANQGSDSIILFERNTTTGLLQPTETKLEVGSPVYLNMTPLSE